MCLPAMFRCKRSHACIGYEHVCDGVPDCRDKSDEQNCKYNSEAKLALHNFRLLIIMIL